METTTQPAPRKEPFLRNYWYVAALANEVRPDAIFSRTLLNEPVIFYRRADGSVVALEDRCCHKHYPLHGGELEGESIRCGYHGMKFGPDGVCVEVPGQTTIPRNCRVRSYPVVERNTWIWIWMGDPALADPSEITDFGWLDSSTWAGRSTVFHVKASYRLIIENLLDLTHLSFVHKSTIGNAAVTDKADVQVERGDNEVKITRWIMDAPPPPAYAACGGFTGNIDRWQIIHYAPPAFCRLYTGACAAGTGARAGNRQQEMGWRNLNAITPETETTSHYFWGQVHNHDIDDPGMTERVFNGVHIAFQEDHKVFEELQRNLDRGARDIPEINTRADAGALAAIRILNRLLSEQDAGHAAMVRPSDYRYAPLTDPA
ncbi:MAG: aromatic ring-hydroxylating dioxygenase subunit alpha [Burkholderiales bacterium]|nr:aromatic ring-hydroxylating dioxygenase subunit alpha [Burkholderiales bacterium]OJW85971.1 MAG: hypothetical protein BGO71_11640 [Burkholderiales bacterium 67-32]